MFLKSVNDDQIEYIIDELDKRKASGFDHIFEGEKRNEMVNYRPISILPIVKDSWKIDENKIIKLFAKIMIFLRS